MIKNNLNNILQYAKISTTLFALFVCFLFGCRHNKTSQELIATFYKNENDLSLIIKKLQTDKHLDSLFLSESMKGLPKIKNEYPEVYNKLKSLDISHASAHKNVSPHGTNWYYFETEWPNEYLICLVFNAHDSSESIKGYYKKDEVSNETWGLGNNWSMFRWVKDKPYKQ